jgi:hypothetical protein
MPSRRFKHTRGSHERPLNRGGGGVSDQPGSCENQFHDDASELGEVYEAAKIALPFLEQMTFRGKARLLRTLHAVRLFRAKNGLPA